MARLRVVVLAKDACECVRLCVRPSFTSVLRAPPSLPGLWLRPSRPCLQFLVSALPSPPDFTIPDEPPVKCQLGCVTPPLKTPHQCLIAYRTKSRLILGSPAKLAPGDVAFSSPHWFYSHAMLQSQGLICLRLFTLMVPLLVKSSATSGA